MEYTEQQQSAIDARDSSIIVSAAAGSGKTQVLVERIISIIADPDSDVSADRMVIVTFTKDAAFEMKNRLDKRMRELINNNPNSEHLIRQQVLLQNAKICTIDSFCFDLLRDNITNQGITSGFDVIDETDEKVMKSKAMEELLDEYAEEKHDEISKIYDYFCLKDYKNLIDLITRVDRFTSSVAVKEDWFRKVIERYPEKFEDSPYFDELFDRLLSETGNIQKGFDECLSTIIRAFRNVDDKLAKPYIEKAEAEVESVEKFMQIINSRQIPSDSDFPHFEDAPNLTAFGKGIKDKIDKDEYKIYKSMHKAAVDSIEKIMGYLRPASDNFYESREVVNILSELVERFNKIVWEKKCKKNAISFDDGERLVRELLTAYDEYGRIIQSEIARRVADYYDIIMIDEYQDSSNKQDMIFRLISRNVKHNDDGNLMYGDNVFLVGDVKQSIYGFRLANPKNFIYVLENSEPYTLNGNSKNKSIFLNTNFRSSEETIDFVNFVFTNIMTGQSCGIDYSKDTEQLHYGATKYSGLGENKFTEIMFIDDDKLKEDGNSTVNPEAEIVAEKIAKMIHDKVQVPDKDNLTRDCRPSDFCILQRTNSNAQPYVEALRRRGISAIGSEEKGYLKSREISVLVDLLKIIANPLQDIPMTAVMFSPMYMFSLEEISYIRSFDKKKMIYQLLIEAVQGDIPDFDERLAVKCGEFLKALERFRFDSVTMTTGELISSIYDNTDFMSVMQIGKEGDKKRANLRLLIQYANNYDKFAMAENGGGIGGFIRHLERLEKNGDYNQGKVANPSDDCVKVQTMHKSKGLQYPFVFLCNLSTEFGFIKQDSKGSVLCDDEGRIGFKLYNKQLLQHYRTFQYDMLRKERMRDFMGEEMRLLYVAMTRAEQKLFICLDNCGMVKKKEKAERKFAKFLDRYMKDGETPEAVMMSARSFADWIWFCLSMHSEFDKIAEKFGYDAVKRFNKESRKLFECEYFDSVSDVSAGSGEAVARAEADEAMTDSILSIINTNYDRTLSETTAKLSVTQISKKFSEVEEFDFHLQRPKFISEERKLTGAERGTAVHTFFQYCSFENAIVDAESEIGNLYGLGFLTKEQAESIDPDKIRAFFSSDLYRRVRAAKSYEREKKFMVSASELKTDNPIFEKIKNTDIMIKGVVDLMYEDEDGIVIIDYKSDRNSSADRLRERYTRQLELYKSAVELMTGKRVKGLVLYSIELMQEIRIL